MSTHIQRSALLPYPVKAMFDMVNDIERYPEFLPWCSAVHILEHQGETMRAEMVVAKGSLKQSFTTCNIIRPEEFIEMNLERGPFSSLHGVWRFTALNENACKITLDLSFEYAGALIRMTLGPLFTQAANTMVDAFCTRAKQLYG